MASTLPWKSKETTARRTRSSGMCRTNGSPPSMRLEESGDGDGMSRSNRGCPGHSLEVRRDESGGGLAWTPRISEARPRCRRIEKRKSPPRGPCFYGRSERVRTSGPCLPKKMGRGAESIKQGDSALVWAPPPPENPGYFWGGPKNASRHRQLMRIAGGHVPQGGRPTQSTPFERLVFPITPSSQGRAAPRGLVSRQIHANWRDSRGCSHNSV